MIQQYAPGVAPQTIVAIIQVRAAAINMGLELMAQSGDIFAPNRLKRLQLRHAVGFRGDIVSM
jgi:hypothetical protein